MIGLPWIDFERELAEFTHKQQQQQLLKKFPLKRGVGRSGCTQSYP